MKKYFKIKGKQKLEGEIRITGAKNSSLPILISTILANDKFELSDVPNIEDIKIISSIMKKLGTTISTNQNDNTILIDNTNLEYKDLSYPEVNKLRASYYFVGAMLGKYGYVKILLPGGCFLGPRPIDLHLKGFKSLGATIKITKENDYEILEASVPEGGLVGDKIFLDFPSVGATINLILAAVNAKGETIIENAAKEPEIVDVVMMLNKMGAKIKGAGTDIIKIKETKTFKGCEHTIIPDRIEAGSYIMMGSLLSNNLKIDNIIPEHLEALFSKLEEIGIILEINDDNVIIKGRKENLNNVIVKTGVYPSFPTDLQQLMTTLMTQIKGKSQIIDTIYPERFRNCQQLNNMQANINVETLEDLGKAKINGVTPLVGTDVIATDLRAGAGLVFAGLIAEGETKIYEIDHILRGYDNIIEKLIKVNANIELIEEE